MPTSHTPMRIRTWTNSSSTTRSMTTTFKPCADVWASKSTTTRPGPTVFSVPQQFDERFYAVRRGAMDWVTGPTEIADDLIVVRLGGDQRWQTKRGIPGQQHIIDWITLDTNMEIFPKPEQNFNQAAGMFDYDFHWFIGDRLTLLSFGGFDFFSEGQQWNTAGIFLSRPPRGSFPWV